MKKSLIALSTGLSALFICFVTLQSAHSYVAGKTPVREVNIEGRYSMMIPEYMVQGGTLNNEASLQYQNAQKEIYVIVIDESKQDFIDAFLELDEYDTTQTPLQNYAHAQMESVRANMQTVTYESPQRTFNTNSGTAIGYYVAGTQEGIVDEMAFTVAFIEGRLNVYMIMSWTFRKTIDQFQTDMDSMICSFKELSGAIAAPLPDLPSVYVFVPDFMTSDPDYPGPVAAYKSNERNLHCIIYQNRLSLWDSAYKAGSNSNESLLDHFTMQQQKDYKTILKNVRSMSTPSKTQINGLDAEIFTFFGQPDNEKGQMYYKVCCVQSTSALYVIQVWSASENKTKNEPTMDEMIHSFRETE